MSKCKVQRRPEAECQRPFLPTPQWCATVHSQMRTFIRVPLRDTEIGTLVNAGVADTGRVWHGCLVISMEKVLFYCLDLSSHTGRLCVKD